MQSSCLNERRSSCVELPLPSSRRPSVRQLWLHLSSLITVHVATRAIRSTGHDSACASSCTISGLRTAQMSRYFRSPTFCCAGAVQFKSIVRPKFQNKIVNLHAWIMERLLYRFVRSCIMIWMHKLTAWSCPLAWNKTKRNRNKTTLFLTLCCSVVWFVFATVVWWMKIFD